MQIHAFSHVLAWRSFKRDLNEIGQIMIYAIVQLTVTDPDTLKAYAEKAGAALEKYSAKPEAMSAQPTRLEGNKPLPDRVVLLSFPDKNAALGWINDPELQDVHALRRASGTCDITLIG